MTTKQFQISVQAINTVCLKFGLALPDMDSRSLEWRLLWPRMIAINLIRKYAKLSQRAIGYLFNRDHSAIHHTLKEFDNIISTDRKLAREAADIEALLEALLNES